MKGLLKRNTTLFYAMSLAATWAWGTSLVVGMETVQTKGWIPFIIWAVANSLANVILTIYTTLTFILYCKI